MADFITSPHKTSENQKIKDKIQAIWSDIRQLKNLELYFIILVILALFIIDIFGEPSSSALTEIFLAALAVLIYGQIETRRTDQEATNQLEKLVQVVESIQVNESTGLQIYEQGRSSSYNYGSVFLSAKSEIYVIGISLTAFRNRFKERASHEFLEPVKNLLANGVKLSCLLLDSNSEAAQQYALDRNEPEIIDRVQVSKREFSKLLQEEFNTPELKENIYIGTYPHFPYAYITLIDPLEDTGFLIVTNYLFGTRRADSPILHIEKSAYPLLFNTYHKMVKKLADDSKPLGIE